MTPKLINKIKLKKRVTTRKVSVCTAWSNSGGRKDPIYNLCDGSADLTVDLKSEIYIDRFVNGKVLAFKFLSIDKRKIAYLAGISQ